MKTFSICLFVIFGVFIANTAFAQTITGIDPDRGLPGQTIAIRVIGTGFVSPVVASFSGSGITITGTNFVNSTEVRVTIKIDPTAAVGARTLTIAGGSAIFTVSKVIGEQPGQRIPQNVVGANDFIDLIDNIVDWIFVVVLVFAVIFIVLAGLQFITGGGDPQAVSQARNKLLWGAVGIAVAVLARGLVTAVRSLIGS